MNIDLCLKAHNILNNTNSLNLRLYVKSLRIISFALIHLIQRGKSLKKKKSLVKRFNKSSIIDSKKEIVDYHRTLAMIFLFNCLRNSMRKYLKN